MNYEEGSIHQKAHDMFVGLLGYPIDFAIINPLGADALREMTTGQTTPEVMKAFIDGVAMIEAVKARIVKELGYEYEEERVEVSRVKLKEKGE